VILCLVVLVEHRLVTDTDTDGHRQTDKGHRIYRASIASRGKNCSIRSPFSIELRHVTDTDSHMPIATTALAQRLAVKNST